MLTCRSVCLQSDNKLKKFLHIISDSVVFPVIYDSNRCGSCLPSLVSCYLAGDFRQN